MLEKLFDCKKVGMKFEKCDMLRYGQVHVKVVSVQRNRKTENRDTKINADKNENEICSKDR